VTSVIEPFVRSILLVVVLFSAVAYLGRLHKYFELTSHFRVQYLLAASFGLLIFLLRAEWRWATAALLAAGMNFSALAPLWAGIHSPAAPASAGNRLKLAVVNVDYSNRKHHLLAAWLEECQPDVVIAQEVDGAWASALLGLSRQYPFSEVQLRENGSGIALYSRFAFDRLPIELPEGDERPGILARLYVNGVSVSLFSVHPRAPIRRGHFGRRNEILSAAASQIRHLPDPKIFAGDLNTSSFSPVYRDFVERTQLSDVRSRFGLLPTWPAWIGLSWFMIPIDHCLVTRNIPVIGLRTGPRIGSDHLPLLVELEIAQAARLP